jgi:hypothetical protein
MKPGRGTGMIFISALDGKPATNINRGPIRRQDRVGQFGYLKSQDGYSFAVARYNSDGQVLQPATSMSTACLLKTIVNSGILCGLL